MRRSAIVGGPAGERRPVRAAGRRSVAVHDAPGRAGLGSALRTAGLRPLRFHDLRHTFVSQLIAAGAPAKYIQEQAGHGSIQVTMDTYGHLFPGADDNAALAAGEQAVLRAIPLAPA